MGAIGNQTPLCAQLSPPQLTGLMWCGWNVPGRVGFGKLFGSHRSTPCAYDMGPATVGQRGGDQATYGDRKVMLPTAHTHGESDSCSRADACRWAVSADAGRGCRTIARHNAGIAAATYMPPMTQVDWVRRSFAGKALRQRADKCVYFRKDLSLVRFKDVVVRVGQTNHVR